MSINKVILLGNLGKEPEIKAFENGGKIASFTLATTKKGYTAKNGTQVADRTEWHNVKCFNGLADVCEKYLHKGSKVYVEGEIIYREYEKDGVKRIITEILVDNLEMCDRPQNAVSNAVPQAQPPQTSHKVDPFAQPNYNNEPIPPKGLGGDDLPF